MEILEPLLRRSRDAALLLEQAEIEAQLGHRDVALRSLAEVERAEPGDIEDLRRVAHSYQNLKEYDRAVSVLSRLMRRRPSDADLLSDRGLCQQLKGESAEAEADLKRAIVLSPDYFAAYLTLGAVYASQGRDVEAVSLYEAALAQKPRGISDDLRGLLRRARKEAAARASTRR